MKKLSTFLVICWYLLSYFISIIVLDQISIIENIWIRILIAHIAATVVIYVGSLVHNNSSLYDPFWSVAPIPITVYLFFMSGQSNITLLNKLFITFPIYNLTQATSNKAAAPMPPPTHMDVTTYFTPLRFPSSRACPTCLAPVMP